MGEIIARLSGKKFLVISVAITAIGYVYNQAMEDKSDVQLACACMFAIAISCAGFAIGQGIDDMGEGRQ